MRRVIRSLAVGLIVAAAAAPQDLFPPGVLLLSRVKRHVEQELARLPNISCLETVQREHQPAGGKMRALDTVRLEVLANGNKEMYAAPGERKFSENHPIKYVGSGVIGDGYFGMYLRDIVLQRSIAYDYKGEEDVGGRLLARYDYRLPLMLSGHVFHLQEGTGTVGMHGSFWVDPQTYDVIRLEMNADDFPPTLPLTEAVTIVNYARTGLGENQAAVLLPESGEFRMTKFSGEVDQSHIAFTHCRLFGAQSTISFGAPDGEPAEPARFGVSSVDDTLRPLPAGLQIAVRLNSKFSADTAVGALVEGAVVENVPAKGPVVVAGGARVRGRIRRLERYAEPVPHFVLALEFTEVESGGIRYRFYADLVEMDTPAGVEKSLATVNKQEVVGDAGRRQIRQVGTELWLQVLPGVASFFVRGVKLELPPGFRTIWKTRAAGQ